jgi:hypothetical protein
MVSLLIQVMFDLVTLLAFANRGTLLQADFNYMCNHLIYLCIALSHQFKCWAATLDYQSA